MTPYDISVKVKRVIQMNGDAYVLNNVYFNPYFLRDLLSKVPELAKAGIEGTTTETETDSGTLISSKLFVKKTGESLDLGSVFLDGENVSVKNRLSSVDSIVRFILHETRKLTEKKTDTPINV